MKLVKTCEILKRKDHYTYTMSTLRKIKRYNRNKVYVTILIKSG